MQQHIVQDEFIYNYMHYIHSYIYTHPVGADGSYHIQRGWQRIEKYTRKLQCHCKCTLHTLYTLLLVTRAGHLQNFIIFYIMKIVFSCFHVFTRVL